MRALSLGFAGLVSLAGCATGTGGAVVRDFSRTGADRVPLRSLELVVVVAGPPRVAEERFTVPGFPPPVGGVPLVGVPEDVQTRDALANELAKSLRAAGFEVTVRVTSPTPTPVATATTASSTVTGAAAPPSPAVPTLGSAEDIDALRARTTADGVLVVRAVPVDRFVVDMGTGTRWEVTALGREQVRDARPVALEGRLLVAQAFLFERASGVRLWSRQSPDYPADGRLTPTHPFLKSGYVQAAGEAPAPAIVRATASARALGRTLLDGFPAAREGDPGARAELLALDAAVLAESDAFFDASHWFFELGAGWGSETSELTMTLGDEELEPLGPGATTPFGVPRIAPRVGWIAPGGTMLLATIPIGLAPSSFGRTYVRDNPDRTPIDADRAVRVEVGGVTAIGAQVEVGRLMSLSPSLFLVPRGGAFVDAWIVDAVPAPWVEADTRIRAGGALGLDVWWRLGESAYVRGGGDVRLGGDVSGGLVFGGALTVAAGLLL